MDMKQIIGNYQNLNLFSFPVSLVHAASFFIIIASILFISMILFLHGIGIHFHLPGKIFIQHPSRPKSLLYYELYKTILNQKVWLIGVALLLISILSFDAGTNLVSREDFFYVRNIESFQGDYTDKKAAQIEDILSDPGDMSSEELNSLMRINEQAQYLRQLSDDNAGFINTYIMDQFFYDSMTEITNTLWIIIALILSLCTLFYQDRRNQMNILLRSTPYGKKIYWRKICISAGLGALYSVILWGFTYCEYFVRYGLTYCQYSIQSYYKFESMPLHISISSYMALTVIFRCITGIYAGILIAFITQIFVNPTQNIIVGGFLFLLPLCLSYVAHMGYENVLITFINQNLQFALKPAELISSFQCQFWNLTSVGKIVLLILPVCTLWTGNRLIIYK